MNKLSVVHVVASLHPSAGGPSRTVVQLTDALAGHSDVDVTLLSQGFAGEPSVPSGGSATRCLIESPSRRALQFGLPIRRELIRLGKSQRPALIHGHGLWLPVNHWTSALARRHGIPLVIQPRGMLEPWALNHKALKKRIAMTMFQRQDLESAKLLVATAEAEYEGIRALGFRQPVAIIPNGVNFDASPFHRVAAVPSDRNARTVLFLSRVHPVKGILNLLHAWAAVMPQGWRLKIAGPDEGGHLAEVTALARALGIDQMVEFLGEVDGEAKRQAYLEADLFVLPTFSENFGVVVAEALAHGVPVITTRGAPWADLQTHACGWWVDIGVEPLVMALREAMALRDDERQAMGARGREYAQRYDWDGIAQKTIDVYRWLLGDGSMPDAVQLN